VIHPDTSFLVDLLREQARGPGPASRWLEAQAATPLAVSVFVQCELEAGAANSAHPARERERIRQILPRAGRSPTAAGLLFGTAGHAVHARFSSPCP
jgi:predicted nucleic acid-binding protein